ncbi:MAG: hypothetical protein ACRCX8_19445 [Sarcina sp.]
MKEYDVMTHVNEAYMWLDRMDNKIRAMRTKNAKEVTDTDIDDLEWYKDKAKSEIELAESYVY